MTVRFFVKGAEHIKVVRDCEACSGTGVEYGEPCPYCDGNKTYEDMESTTPEAEVGTMWARDFIAMLGIQLVDESDLYGEITPDKLGDLRQRLVSAANRDKARAPVRTDARESANFHYGAITDDRILGRINDVLAVVVAAQESGRSVIFA